MTLAGQKLTGPEAGLYWLRVRLARGCHDQVELSLWPRTKFASAQPGVTSLKEIVRDELILFADIRGADRVLDLLNGILRGKAKC